MKKEIVLLGIGGHAKGVVDSIEQLGEYQIVGFLDDAEKKDCSYRGYQVIGNDDILERLRKEGLSYAFPTVGYMGRDKTRNLLYEKLIHTGFHIPNIIDPTAILAADAELAAEGVYIGKRAVVGAGSSIGRMAIVNTGAIIEHDCAVGAFSHIAVGAVVCGESFIGDNAFIGAGATIIQGISVGKETIVGAGVAVIKNVPAQRIVYGCNKMRALEN